MSGVIQRFLNFFRPIRVQSLDSFVVFLKHLGCASVTAELLARDQTTNTFGCIICYSAKNLEQRRVIFCRRFEWLKEAIGATQDLGDRETRDALSRRLCSVVEPTLVEILKEVSGIEVAIVDLNGERWTVTDGCWAKAS